MKRLIPFFSVAVVALFVGFIFGWVKASSDSAQDLDRVVVMGWGDGKYGPAFYGAHVYLDPISDKSYSVKALVYIGTTVQAHEIGELGRAKDRAEAVLKWGKIDWREDGLHIGNGTNHYFLPRERLERHR